MTFESFLTCNGYLFIISTILIVLFQAERAEKPTSTATATAAGPTAGTLFTALAAIRDTFREGLLLFSLPAIQMLALVIFTRKLGCAAVDAGLGLKLQEGGMPKADLICFATVSLVLSLVLPALIHIHKPLDLWVKSFKIKLLIDAGKIYIYICVYRYILYCLCIGFNASNCIFLLCVCMYVCI